MEALKYLDTLRIDGMAVHTRCLHLRESADVCAAAGPPQLASPVPQLPGGRATSSLERATEALARAFGGYGDQLTDIASEVASFVERTDEADARGAAALRGGAQ